ncbi:hypothetical protein K437DRAFT_295126 [Tilletiaria anomala UBC 951]|uniref:Uncharacterized protein n=1 Tax=Tilletiaria anomala (strain ATCC 24038 / CBS 436.72 / UBC 951) TaxID=1037660 RepID=A0A066VT22_TILAU|nr:uncharacterized protein K437DRAFT_295126 [Tilletiaria anomala UBC 951]KDN43413.1 hypothetical protein K437DRAFT_295126 [Tilletiaria anomala UBC 951]
MCSYTPSFVGAGSAGRLIGEGRSARRKIQLPKGKGKAKSKELPLPQAVADQEEAISYGIQSEERGERYITSGGPTAQRAYQTALMWYRRAFELAHAQVASINVTSPTEQELQQDHAYNMLIQCADAAYNAARTHYIFATHFAFPPTSLQHLEESIGLYQQAASAEERARGLHVHSASVSSVSRFRLDIEYNLASSQLAAAELVFQLEDSFSEAARKTEGALHDTAQRFSQVAQRQAQELASRYDSLHTDDADVIEASEDDDGAAEVDADKSSTSEEPLMVYASSTIELPSLADTVENCISCIRIFLTEVPNVGADDTRVYFASEIAAAALNATQMIVPERISESEKLQFAFIQRKALMLSLEVEMALADSRLEVAEAKAQENVASSYQQNFEALLAAQARSRSISLSNFSAGDVEDPLEGLCQLADLQQDLAWLGVRGMTLLAASGSSVPSTLLDSTWELATGSSKLFLRALSTLSKQPLAQGVNASIVLGGSLNQAPSPAARARLGINANLSELSLLRALPCFRQKHIQKQAGTLELNEGATSAWTTVKSLLDNARIYARRACSEAGLTWALSIQAPSPLPPTAARLSSGDHYRSAAMPLGRSKPGAWL